MRVAQYFGMAALTRGTPAFAEARPIHAGQPITEASKATPRQTAIPITDGRIGSLPGFRRPPATADLIEQTPGHWAGLIPVDGDFIAHIRALEKMRFVMLQGRQFP